MEQLFANFVRDLCFSFRQVGKKPGFALIAVLVLALGTGGPTAVFGVLYQTVLRPLPYPEAKRLEFIHSFFPKSQVWIGRVSGFDCAEIKRHTDVFSNAGVFYWNHLTLTGLGNPRHLDVVNASAPLFNVLDLKPRLGRTFSEAEDQYGAAGAAILSDSLWRNALGSDPHVLGRIIRLNGMPYTIVGVMPERFRFPSHETQLWIPVALPRGEFTIQGGRLEKWLHMVARLSPGVTPKRAQSVLQAIADDLGSSFPGFYPRRNGWRFTMRQLLLESSVLLAAYTIAILGGPHEPEVYYPELQERTEATYLVLRTKGDFDPTVTVRKAIAKFDPRVAVYDVQFMDGRVAAFLKMRRFVALLLNGLAVMGMVLAIVGLHGSLAHLVELRQREIGIRMALGARKSQIVRMILSRTGLVAASGLAVGSLGAVTAGRAVRSQLFGMQLTDMGAWIGVLGAILVASAISAYFPAWRAAGIEPSVALRHE